MPVLCIVCTAFDPKATPRTIRGFDRNIILRGYGDGLYEDRFGNVWLKTTPEPLRTASETERSVAEAETSERAGLRNHGVLRRRDCGLRRATNQTGTSE